MKRFYDDKYDGNPYESCTNCKIEEKQGEIYVSESLFIDQSQGSIDITSSNIKFLHSSCLFYKCSKNTYGGSIYIKSDSSVIQYRCCVIGSIIEKDWGLFSYTELKNDNKNYVIESSVSNCKKETAYHTISMKYGNCGIHSSNISKNSVYSSSAFFIYLAKGLNVINFSTFENSNSSTMCLQHNEANDGYLDNFCNIVNSPQKTSEWGVIFIASNSPLRLDLHLV